MMMQDVLKKEVLQQNLSRYTKFTHKDWFLELSNLEVAFFEEYIVLFLNKPQEFLEVLANRKKQIAIFQKLSKTVKHKANKKEQSETVEQFFEQVSMDRLFTDLSVIPLAAPYEVDKNVAQYVIGKKEGDEFIAFDATDFYDGELHLIVQEQSVVVTVQALIYFIFVNEMQHRLDEERIVHSKCEYADAIFAKSYADIVLADKLKDLFILKQTNFATSIFIAAATFGKTIRFVSDVYWLPAFEEAQAFREELQDNLIEIISKREETLSICNENFLEKKIEKLEQKEKLHIKKQAELQQKWEKQKEKYDEQLEKVRALKQELNAKADVKVQHLEADKQLTEQVIDLKQQVKTAKDDLRESKKEHQKELATTNKKLKEVVAENERLVGNVSALQQQLTAEKRVKLQNEELTFEKWIQKGPDFLHNMTLEQEQELKGFIAIAENMMCERSLALPKTDLATNRIGYCKVEEEGHFINFGDGQWQEIVDIPSQIYLSDAQFVEVTKDFEFVRPFHYHYSEGPMDHSIAHFVAVEERHNQAFAKVDGKTMQIKYRDNAFIKHDQVISINMQEELVSYYQSRSIQLDDWLQSIRIKRHEPLYVLMALANGYVVRGLDENQRFIELDQDVLAHSFVILDEQEHVQFVDQSGLMYKRSTMYKNKQLASVSEIDEDIYVLKQNQEYVQLHDVPYQITLDLGDMVWVDESNRFIELMEMNMEEQYMAVDTIEKKLLDGGRKVTRKTPKAEVDKDKELLIIGNIRISERYKKYFGEHGYAVEVVDGTGPFEKIRQACSKYDTILYSTAFTSHKNSGKMNIEVTKPYILCDSTAPKVMHFALESAV